MSEEQVKACVGVSMGGDPEFFFEREGKIVGAEKVLEKEGKEVVAVGATGYNFNAFVLDGVQVELNPTAQGCRTGIGHEISRAFQALSAHMKKMEGVSCSFKTTIELEKEELNSLSDRSRVFGCAPSLNLYDSGAKITVDAATYLKRSAGGHVHLGFNAPGQPQEIVYQNREQLVPILDVLLGLPCVLIDRDPGNAERRLHYGRAGEYRLPNHGLEYRTLSNFWLRAFPLTSFVLGQGRLAVNVLGSSLIKTQWVNAWPAKETLLATVDMDKVREAINSNDLALAQECWEPVKGWIGKHVTSYDTGLTANVLPNFDYFAKKVQEKGIEFWFPKNPVDHWCNLVCSDSFGGWESFIGTEVSKVRWEEARRNKGQEHPF